MAKQIIKVPTIKDDDSGFDKILMIAAEVFSNPKRNFDFDFSNCSKLDHNGVVLLGGLARYVNYQNSLATRAISEIFRSAALSSFGVMFKVDTMSSLIYEHIISNNFLSHFTQSNFDGYPEGDYIGYREHTNLLNADKIATHLNDHWLTGEKLKLSPLLKSEIVSRIFEIFMNAYGHGTSIQKIDKLGVYSCGQYDKKEKKLDLSVVDFGPGIVNNVKRHNIEINNDIKAMEWALVRGHTTHTDSIDIQMPRGLGFDLLKEFVGLNKGHLRVYSNGVKAFFSDKGIWCVEASKCNFEGTLVSISVNCDDRYYHFSSESEGSPQHYF
jgi:hypothetical protein